MIVKKPGLNGNAYSGSRYLYESIQIKNVIISEDIDWEPGKDEKGGIIVLSTDVNAIAQSENKFINFIKQKAATLKNRATSTSMIDKVAQGHNLVGWTVGHGLSGRYTAKNGTPFGEKSLSVEMVGIDTKTLLSIAEELCRNFKQETVLVKNYNDGRIYTVNGEHREKGEPKENGDNAI